MKKTNQEKNNQIQGENPYGEGKGAYILLKTIVHGPFLFEVNWRIF